jgi:hypothetical protein
MNDHRDKPVDRRRLLRRAGTVAAGLAGTATVGAATAGPAAAASGEPVLQGQLNVAAEATTLRNTGVQAVLRLEHDRVWPGTDGRLWAEPALRIKPSGTDLSHLAEAGSISMAVDGNLWLATRSGSQDNVRHIIHTTANSNRIVPLQPQRVLDTRYAESRGLVIEQGYLDASGRVLAGKSITIRLTDHLYVAEAVFGTVTVVQPGQDGFAQVYPSGTARPTNFSTINYAPGQVLSNSFVCGVRAASDQVSDAISVYTNRTTHLIVDLTAVVVGVGQVNPASTLPTRGDSMSAGSGVPAWER